MRKNIHLKKIIIIHFQIIEIMILWFNSLATDNHKINLF